MPKLRLLMSLEAAAFLAAALVHAGILVGGYEHPKARVAETVIALVLLAGVGWSLLRPDRSRRAAVASQGFALVGTLVGLFTIAVGVGPRTAPDLAFHAGILAVLTAGLLAALRARPAVTRAA
ncbi:hypothetical protein ACOQFB_01330 [Anaeromyxobacter sp. Red801]|uniref:hypothetical protein n=1 Tax=Anaeromyxobacter sp. Red801 TaxID=3411632 RepID=UPI003BA2B9E2